MPDYISNCFNKLQAVNIYSVKSTDILPVVPSLFIYRQTIAKFFLSANLNTILIYLFFSTIFVLMEHYQIVKNLDTHYVLC